MKLHLLPLVEQDSLHGKISYLTYKTQRDETFWYLDSVPIQQQLPLLYSSPAFPHSHQQGENWKPSPRVSLAEI